MYDTGTGDCGDLVCGVVAALLRLLLQLLGQGVGVDGSGEGGPGGVVGVLLSAGNKNKYVCHVCKK